MSEERCQGEDRKAQGIMGQNQPEAGDEIVTEARRGVTESDGCVCY